MHFEEKILEKKHVYILVTKIYHWNIQRTWNGHQKPFHPLNKNSLEYGMTGIQSQTRLLLLFHRIQMSHKDIDQKLKGVLHLLPPNKHVRAL